MNRTYALTKKTKKQNLVSLINTCNKPEQTYIISGVEFSFTGVLVVVSGLQHDVIRYFGDNTNIKL